MKKSIVAAILAGVMLLSGCSGVSQESVISSVTSVSTPTVENSTSNEISSVDNKEREEEFNEKCKKIVEQMEKSFGDVELSMQFSESSVQYQKSDKYSSKLYMVKGNNEDDRYLLAFLDIYSTDEYEFFQSTKEFVSFVNQNALDICGRNQFIIDVNSQENGLCDIGIIYDPNSSSITYADRSIRSAYSERLKSIDILKDCAEQLNISGLIKYDDVSKIYKAYDVSSEYQGKTLTHKWYKIDEDKDEPVFVTYIDDGTYDSMSDEELIYYAYNAVFAPENKLAYNVDGKYYFAFKSDKSESYRACTIYYYQSKYFREHSSCDWYGEYEHLNSNPLNQQLLEILKGKAANQPSTSESVSEVTQNSKDETFKKEKFTIGASQIETSKSNKWYYVEGNMLGITAVTYVDDYNDIDDDIFVRNAFMDIIDITAKKPHKGAYSFNWAKETGEVVCHAFSMNIMGNTSQSIEWKGDYSHLNDNSTFQTLFKSWINTEN